MKNLNSIKYLLGVDSNKVLKKLERKLTTFEVQNKSILSSNVNSLLSTQYLPICKRYETFETTAKRGIFRQY